MLATKQLHDIQKNSIVPLYVRSFKFNLEFTIDENDHPPPEELVFMLSRFLISVKRLQKLWLAIPGLYTRPFASHFYAIKLLLPDIRTLIVGPYCHFAVLLCPTVATISVNGHAWRKKRRYEIALPNRCRALLDAARQAPKLVHLVLHEWYIVETLEDVLKAVPGIRNLTLAGEQYEDKLPDLLTVLSRFTNLQYLSFDDAIYIKLGNEPTTPGGTLIPGLDCKADYDIPEVGTHHIDPFYCRIAEMVTRACKSLRVVRIGTSARAEIKRHSDGRFVEVA
ncbi:hypothetical protein MMC11_002205, partial [Xylographa trunciseda]|nr:hypothetical protein [Xylographa trunciseda]